MLRSIAKIAATLDVDGVANHVVERLYKRDASASGRFAARFQVLTYHRVSNDAHPFFTPTTPAVFEQQMTFLSRCYNVLPLAELVERSHRGDIPNRSVAITFDDGYRDNFEYAFPILKKHKLSATIFLATGVIGGAKRLWHDRIFDSFRYATAEAASLADVNIPRLNLGTDEERHRAIRPVLDRARRLYGADQERFVEDVEDKLQPIYATDRTPRMLDWAQVREMQNGGIEFGSHTVNHPILACLPKAELYRELQDSKDAISGETRTPVTSFAYPNGREDDYNDLVKAALRDCGYTSAVTTRMGFNLPATDPLELRRGQPWQPEIELFRLNFFLQRHGLAS